MRYAERPTIKSQVVNYFTYNNGKVGSSSGWQEVGWIFPNIAREGSIVKYGEIRGNNRLFDLATFVGFYQDRIIYSYLLEGYCEIAHLTDEDLYATELMALFIILRFLGKKVNSNSREHWYQLAKKQLDQIIATPP